MLTSIHERPISTIKVSGNFVHDAHRRCDRVVVVARVIRKKVARISPGRVSRKYSIRDKPFWLITSFFFFFFNELDRVLPRIDYRRCLSDHF